MAHDYHYKSWMMFIGVVLLVVAFFRPVKLYFHKAFYKPPVTSTVAATPGSNLVMTEAMPPPSG